MGKDSRGRRLLRRAVLATGMIPCLTFAAGCGSVTLSSGANRTAGAPCTNRVGFAGSLVSDTRGQTTPMAAADWFATHDQNVAQVPVMGWRVVGHEAHGTTLQAGSVYLHVVQGPDGTWQVDSGYRCI